jgi:putative transcriptional regulator
MVGPWTAEPQEWAVGSLAGKLLVATPNLLDPNFYRTVVLMCVHEEEGALGVVLNRPTESDVLEHVPEWHHLAASPPVVFVGGPVEPGGALAVGRLAQPAEGAGQPGAETGTTGAPGTVSGGSAGSANGEPPEGWTAVTSEVGLLDLGRTPEEFAGVGQVRFFSGHSGWGAEQVVAEIEEDAWFVVDSAPGDAFTREPQTLWREVLRRQSARLAMFADYPDDPRVN